jgi:hypothetical protein
VSILSHIEDPNSVTPARFGEYFSLAGGIICAFFGLVFLRWYSLLGIVGAIIVLVTKMQNRYKIPASIATVLFSVIYLILWWLMARWSLIFGLQYVGFFDPLLGIAGGLITLFYTVSE